MLQDILACFVLEIETSNPSKRKHHFTDNAGNQQKCEKDTNWKIQVQAIKNMGQVAISNILKPGAAGVTALAFKPVQLNYAAVKVSLHFCQDRLQICPRIWRSKGHGREARGERWRSSLSHRHRSRLCGAQGSPFTRNLSTQHKKRAGDRLGFKHV